ncbi:cysteine-rich repeat secretory protein 38-like [Diospyros lotus]|uniref:cysteine-rich repeat secretory protein 38-like n=1 Tax=Diospyros lotus TaxID=55363 RepID=UPI00224F2191|nr:cysteine-rich repeat secretory protein 38-like [Diospyros lotus]
MHYFSSNPFLIIPFLLFFPTTCVISAGPIHFCFGKNSTSPTYESNLNDLADLLQAKVPRTGFGVGSVCQGQTRANGLALCRGDTSSSACNTCVVDASRTIRDGCPSNQAAILWLDHCFYKYSNEEFFGEIDNKNKFYMFNVKDVQDPESFNKKTKYLLSQLANKAYVNPVLYGTGELELEGSRKLYGLVQCTRDLSSSDCKKCLDGAISELLDCCDGKEGGRVIGGSCNFRYEIYPFVNT